MATQYAVRTLGPATPDTGSAANSDGEDQSGDTSDAPSDTTGSSGQVQVQLTDGTVVLMSPANAQTAITAGQAYAAQSANSAGTVSPADTVYGNCGSSYVSLYERSSGGYPVKMTTGFHTTKAAISYGWNVNIIGQSGTGYSYGYYSSGDLFFRTSWNGSHTSHKNYPRGLYVASVHAFSYAIMIDGSVCSSEGPVARRRL